MDYFFIIDLFIYFHLWIFYIYAYIFIYLLRNFVKLLYANKKHLIWLIAKQYTYRRAVYPINAGWQL